MNLVDPEGRKTIINDGTQIYTWKNIDNQWGFYDNDNNIYSGDLGYINEYTKALIELMSTNTGQCLVTTLVDSKDFELSLTNNGEKYGSSYNSIYKEINWKYNNPEAMPTTNGKISNAVINLGHELAHALYHLNDGDMDKVWYSIKYEDAKGNINKINIPISEIYTTHIENKLRAEKNLPLRTFYSESRDEYGILHPIIKDGRSLFYNTNEKTKFSEILRRKNRYTYIQVQ